MTFFVDPTWLWPLAAAPVIGSFLGVLVLRLPAGETIALGRSICRSCGAQLGPRDLIPLLSWVVLRGRCRHCGAWLGWFYPGIELLALGVAVWATLALPGDLIWIGCLLGWWLAALAVIDARTMMLPDLLTLPLIVLGLGVTYVLAPGAIIHHAAGAVAGYAAMAGIGVVYRRLRGREGIGGGDMKLTAAAGAWVGWAGLPGVIFIAALSGLAAAGLLGRSNFDRDPAARIPFGPCLALGLWTTWVHGPLVLP